MKIVFDIIYFKNFLSSIDNFSCSIHKSLWIFQFRKELNDDLKTAKQIYQILMDCVEHVKNNSQFICSLNFCLVFLFYWFHFVFINFVRLNYEFRFVVYQYFQVQYKITIDIFIDWWNCIQPYTLCASPHFISFHFY